MSDENNTTVTLILREGPRADKKDWEPFVERLGLVVEKLWYSCVCFDGGEGDYYLLRKHVWCLEVMKKRVSELREAVQGVANEGGGRLRMIIGEDIDMN